MESMKLIEHYEGFVESIHEGGFCAKIISVTDSDSELGVIFPTSLVKEEDLEFFKPGGIFDWKIFENDSTSLVFRKDRWTQEEIDQAEIEAAKLFEIFGNKENIK